MNRIVLLLNVVVLVVTFLLVLTTTDSQIDLMRTASEIANARGSRRDPLASPGASIAYLRVVQSLEGLHADQTGPLTAGKLRTIFEAVRAYQRSVEHGVSIRLYESDEGTDLRGAHQTLGKTARQEVERVLSAGFSDGALVQRLATEVVRNCR